MDDKPKYTHRPDILPCATEAETAIATAAADMADARLLVKIGCPARAMAHLRMAQQALAAALAELE